MGAMHLIALAIVSAAIAAAWSAYGPRALLKVIGIGAAACVVLYVATAVVVLA